MELARPLAKQFHVLLNHSDCIRHRATQAQSSLRVTARRTNVLHAFSLKKPIQATHVAIIDDVITTGQTVSELARVLLFGGVQQVDIWCCACADPVY